MQEVVLNLLPNGVPPVCYISQYDGTSRVIRFHLLNGTEPLTLNGSETITLNFRKPDREEVTLSIENTSSNYIDLVISSELSDKHGEGFGEFRIQGLGTLSFKMYIESDAYGDSLKTRSVSGPIATFETDLAENLIKLDVDLEPIQDLHGYDNPWPAGGGINQITVNRTKGNAGAYGPNVTRDWDYTKYYVGFSYNNYYTEENIVSYNVGNDIVSVTQTRNAYGIAFPIGVKPNHQYYVGCTFEGTVKLAASYFDSTGSIIRYDSNMGTSRVITTPDNCSTLVLVVYDGSASGVQVSASDIFINDPATVTEYTPYSNICPISGHNSAILSRVGKNWLNLNRTNVITNAGLYPSTIRTFTENDIWIGISRNNYFNNSRISSYSIDSNKVTVLTTAGGYGVGFPIRCKPSTAYKMSNKEGYNLFNTCFFDADGNYLSDTTSSTFTTPNNCAWILVVFSGTANIEASYINPQLELGSTATDYEPYESDPTPITVNLGQTVYKGKLYSEQRKVLVTSILVDLGDFSWYHSTSETRNYFYVPKTQFSVEPKGIPPGQTNDDISSQYRQSTYANVVNGLIDSGFSIASTTKYLYLYDKTKTDMTTDEFRAAVTGVKLLYELAEPFFIDLTQIQTASIDSTPIASFETTLARPLETSEHYFSCSQAEGTPTPDSPIPVTGVSEITAYRTGKNLTNITISATNHWGTDTQELVSFLNTLPIGVYTISNKYRINELPGNNKVQHGRFYITALIDGSQTPVLSYSVVTDTSPTVGKIYEESGTFEITASNKGKFNHAYRYCDQDTTHTGDNRGSYTCYDIQLEKASSATEYEPYNGESITVSLGGTYYGGKLVQSEDGSRKIVLDKAFTKINALTWSYVPSYTYFTAYPTNIKVNSDAGKKLDGLTSDIYTNRTPSQTGSGDIDLSIAGYQTAIRIKHKAYTDVNSFVAAVGDHDIVYPLETPIEIDLPDGDPLTTVAGENNVYCNTGDTALTYYYNMVADPIRIPALVGTNNVYSDAGDVDVEYYTTLEGGND